MRTVGELILKSTQYLEQKGVDTPRLDAEILLSSILKSDRLSLYMDWNKPLIELEIAAYREMIRQRGQERMPVSRILGRKEFYGRNFIVSKDTFVPRPETEGLVELAIELLQVEETQQVDRPVIFEVGTGTGCIIVTLALERGVGEFHASDVSPGALKTAQENAQLLGVGRRIDFRQGPNLVGFGGPVNMLVSNPPYIDTTEISTLDPEVKDHDPALALDGGELGLTMFRGLIREAIPVMAPGGIMVFEMGENHTQEILDFLADFPQIHDAEMKRDMAGRPRYFIARLKI